MHMHMLWSGRREACVVMRTWRDACACACAETWQCSEFTHVGCSRAHRWRAPAAHRFRVDDETRLAVEGGTPTNL